MDAEPPKGDAVCDARFTVTGAAKVARATLLDANWRLQTIPGTRMR